MRVRGWMLAAGLAMLLIAACSEDDTVSVVTDDGSTPAPTWVYVALTQADRIQLRWTDPSNEEGGFSLERATSAGGPFEEIARTEENIQTYVDLTVTAGETYYYRVRTVGAIGQLSPPGDAHRAVAVNNSAPQVPSDPSPANNAFDLDLPGLVSLTWETADSDGEAPRCRIYFGNSRAALDLEASDLTEYSYTLTDTLPLSTFFYWRVAAADTFGATALSPVWSFGTTVEELTIPAGEFVRGDCGDFYPADPQRFCPEQRLFYVDAFTIDKFEVSNQLFAQFLNELLDDKWITVVNGEVWNRLRDTLFAEVYPAGDNHSGIEYVALGTSGAFVPRAGLENHPVVEVTWFGAQRYAQHYGRRLPTELEWEKAARGTAADLGYYYYDDGGTLDSLGLGYPYPWGATANAARCNYLNSGDPFETTVGVGTTPVGFYNGQMQSGFATGSNASPYGVFDLAGNVVEWCADPYLDYQVGTNPEMRVVKGGGWRKAAVTCQTFWREAVTPDSSDNVIGFRTVAAE